MAAQAPRQSSGPRAWVARLVEHRRVLARLLLVAGGLVAAEQLLPLWPRQAELELDLGARHGEVRELRLSYLRGGEELKGVSLRYAAGAPSRVHHTVSLPQGEVELLCELRGEDGASTTHWHALQVPAEGVQRFSAEPAWKASP